MTHDDIGEQVRRIVAEHFRRPLAEVVPEANFVQDFDADSLDIVILLDAIERDLDVRVPDEEVERLRTVQDAMNWVGARLR